MKLLNEILPSCLTALLLALTQAIAAPEASTVGDPNAPADLPAAVRDAYAAGAKKIIIAPGEYLVPDGPGAFLYLDEWRDMELSGDGVTLTAQVGTDGKDERHFLIQLNRCQGVTISGFSLSQTEVPYRQGRVVSIDEGDGTPKSWSCVWKPDTGYPGLPETVVQEPVGCFNIVDKKSRRFKVPSGDIYDLHWSLREDRSYLLTGFHGRPNIETGDWIVARRTDITIPYKIRLVDSKNCTVQGISVSRSGYAPLREDGGGGNTYSGCRWHPGPKPTGAEEEPLISGCADGLQSIGAAKGPLVDRCLMEGLILDDCISIHGSCDEVLAVSGRMVTLKSHECRVAVGDPVMISSPSTPHFRTTVLAVDHGEGGRVVLTLDKDYPGELVQKMVAWSPAHCGAGYRISNCRLGNTRARAILNKSENGEIINNLIDGATTSLGPEGWYGESAFWSGLLIQNNTFTNCGERAISIHGNGSGTIDNLDIVIRDNKFLANYAAAIELNSAKNVLITGNTFSGRSEFPENMPLPNIVKVSNSDDIQIEKNTLLNDTGFANPLVLQGEDVTGLSSDL